MLTYDPLKDRPCELLAATGLMHEEFARLLPAFTTAYAALSPPDKTGAGKPRQRRIGAGAQGALAQMTAKLLFIGVYQKTQALQTMHGLHFTPGELLDSSPTAGLTTCLGRAWPCPGARRKPGR